MIAAMIAMAIRTYNERSKKNVSGESGSFGEDMKKISISSKMKTDGDGYEIIQNSIGF
jgi:hypothetical protein